MVTKKILKHAGEITPKLIKIRRILHQNPELGSEIHQTKQVVINELEEMGIEVITGENTGVIGILEGKKQGKTVLIRADMDALPIAEISSKAYSSLKKDRMHACGHDAHTAWVLGAAAILVNMREYFSGTVKFVFQPSEEGYGGISAKDMLRAGVLENPKVDIAIAAHVHPQIPVGKIGVKAGPVTGVCSRFKIVVTGKSGHASEPSKCIDPILILNQIYTSIQTIQRAINEPDHPAVITVTQFQGGHEGNVIPLTAELSGTIRNFYEDENQKLLDQIKKNADAIANMYGGEAEFSYLAPGPSCKNDKEVTNLVKQAGGKILKEENVIKPPIFMGGDDFAYITELVPSCYFFVGIRNEAEGIIYPLHNEKFDLDEMCLGITPGILAQSIIDFLL